LIYYFLFRVGGAFGETSNSDKPNLVNLLIELKKQLSFNEKLLTIAVCADPSRSSQAYDIRGVSANVDMVNIMTYDYGGAKGGTGVKDHSQITSHFNLRQPNLHDVIHK